MGSDLSIHHVGSDHGLLAGITAGGDLSISLWDLKYRVIIEDRSLTFYSWKDAVFPGSVFIQILSVDMDQALVVVSHPPSTAKRKGRVEAFPSNLVSIPVAVPFSASLATAMDHAEMNECWLRHDASRPPPISVSEKNTLESMSKASKSGKVDASIINAIIGRHLHAQVRGYLSSGIRAELRIREVLCAMTLSRKQFNDYSTRQEGMRMPSAA